ncbi:hypothetical protein [Desulfosporosinus sp. FKB]|uniref:hypothetical protein n=1 Tax=Desulfosporosinus sp. FKB TaxID=1969835 RepID=UPI000B49EB01|nr:hypothetical protein [Desulfosporosinus sp. FKB]
MTENEASCSCHCKKESNNMPILIGGIIVYELAVAVILLTFIFWELEKPCGCDSRESCCQDESKGGVVELSTEE